MRTTLLVPFIFVLFSHIWAQDTEKNKDFLYVGHRGASYLAPENTLASIQLAWELGADAAECDVMLTSDKKVVVFHDKNTRKLTGENLIIKKATWNDLKDLVVIPRETNHPEFIHETIPLLQDVLTAIPENRMLVIEIKTGTEILPYLEELIAQYWKKGQISFIAFDFETIRQTKALYPSIPCYYLSMFKPDFNKHFDAVVAGGLDGVDLRYTIIDRDLVERCHASGLDVWCWTVNDPGTALTMKQFGVSAVTSDRPAWLKRSLQSKN